MLCEAMYSARLHSRRPFCGVYVGDKARSRLSRESLMGKLSGCGVERAMDAVVRGERVWSRK